MKKLPILLVFSLLISYQLCFAQGEKELGKIKPDSVTVSAMDEIEDTNTKLRIFESDESMSKGIQNALILEVPSANEKLVEDVWKKFAKDYGGKTKKSKGGKNEFTTTGAEIVGVNGVNTLNIYSSASPGSSGNIEMKLWFDMGEEYLESNRTSQYEEAERFALKFAHEVKIENTKVELKEAEKKLKNLEGNLKSLNRQNENYHKDIETYEKKIEEAKENIVTNVEQQEDTGKKIELQEQLVEEIDRRLRGLRKH